MGKAQDKDSKAVIEKAYWEAADKIPGPALTRAQLASFLGISARRLANMDSEGCGPGGGFNQGRRKLYLKAPAIEFILSRVKV